MEGINIGMGVNLTGNFANTTAVPFSANLVFSYPLISNLTDMSGGSAATVSRSSSGYFERTGGLVETATANNPRYQNGGVLVESSNTNILLDEQWGGFFINLTDGIPPMDMTVVNPEGGLGAYKFETVTDTVLGLMGQTPTHSALPRSLSCYVKRGSISTISLLVAEESVPIGVDLRTLEDDAWHFLEVINAPSSDAAGLLAEGEFVAGDYFYFWLPTLIDGDRKHTPIEVGASPTTRTGESLTLDSHVSLPARTTNWAVAFNFVPFGFPASSQPLMLVNGETNGRRLLIGSDGTIAATFGGNTVSGGIVNIGQNNRILFSANGTTMNLFVNGVKVTENVGVEASGSQTSITFSSGLAVSGIISDVRGYSRYFSTEADALLEASRWIL